MDAYQIFLSILLLLWLTLRVFRLRLSRVPRQPLSLQNKYPPIIAETGELIEYPKYPHMPYFTDTSLLFEQSYVNQKSPSPYVYCGACGKQILRTDNFCPYCGAEQHRYDV